MTASATLPSGATPSQGPALPTETPVHSQLPAGSQLAPHPEPPCGPSALPAVQAARPGKPRRSPGYLIAVGPPFPQAVTSGLRRFSSGTERRARGLWARAVIGIATANNAMTTMPANERDIRCAMKV
ncbi:MAG: hypothetical protein ABJC74_13660 [Gemmatimonadota bacterium]